MKYFISFLLQCPACYLLGNGLAALTGLGTWWCVPIAVVVVIMYVIGEIVRRED
jgi:hypothetical protein